MRWRPSAYKHVQNARLKLQLSNAPDDGVIALSYTEAIDGAIRLCVITAPQMSVVAVETQTAVNDAHGICCVGGCTEAPHMAKLFQFGFVVPATRLFVKREHIGLCEVGSPFDDICFDIFGLLVLNLHLEAVGAVLKFSRISNERIRCLQETILSGFIPRFNPKLGHDQHAMNSGHLFCIGHQVCSLACRKGFRSRNHAQLQHSVRSPLALNNTAGFSHL